MFILVAELWFCRKEELSCYGKSVLLKIFLKIQLIFERSRGTCLLTKYPRRFFFLKVAISPSNCIINKREHTRNSSNLTYLRSVILRLNLSTRIFLYTEKICLVSLESRVQQQSRKSVCLCSPCFSDAQEQFKVVRNGPVFTSIRNCS